MANEITTYLAKLSYGASTPTTSIDIKSFPSILAPKSAVEVTNMADGARRYIQGIRETPENFEFTANWDATVFTALNALNSETLDELNKRLDRYCENLNVSVEFFQSNHEGDIVDEIQNA